MGFKPAVLRRGPDEKHADDGVLGIRPEELILFHAESSVGVVPRSGKMNVGSCRRVQIKR